MAQSRPTDRLAFLSGVFLLCMSVLMMQIVQTRILSVVSLYYLAFFSISMAMLGLTAGALIVYYRLGDVTPDDVGGYLARIATAFALAVALCFLFELASPLPVVRWATFAIVWLKLILLLAAPYVLGGIAISLALTRSRASVGLTYGIDLVGAAAGCLVTLAVLNLIDAPSSMFLIAGLAAAAGWCFSRVASPPLPRGSLLDLGILRRPGIVALGLAVLAIANGSVRLGLQPISAKANTIEKLDQFDYVRWNTFSRISVNRPIVQPPFLWGPSPAMPQRPLIEQRDLNIDGFAGTIMPRWSPATGAEDHLRYDVTNLAYYARHTGRSAVIGVGSGRDLLSAHVFGFRDITGVELNPVFVDLLTDPAKLRGFSGVADLPGVRLVVDDGRSWFTRTRERFDVLQMSMVDTLAATGVGAFSLSENGLYTVEGWTAFLSALRPDGLFTVSRWHSRNTTAEIGRAVSLAVASLSALGVSDPARHIYIAGVDNLATIIVARSPFSAADLRALDAAAATLRFDVLAEPGRAAADPVLADLLGAHGIRDLTVRSGRYALDVSPPTDARPFFFYQLRFTHLSDVTAALRLWHGGESVLSGGNLVAAGNLVAIGTLLIIVLLSAVAVIGVVLLPARSAVRAVDRRLASVGSIYFLLIGLGFMFVEIGLIQRISVFLGHPVYALSIGLFSIILATGIGSMLSEHFRPSTPRAMVLWLGALGAYLLLLPVWAPALLHSELAAAGLALRAVASVAIIFPAGLLMGFGFPTGMRLVSAVDARPTPWLWGVNGAAGVLAAGLAVACSIAFSVDTTIRLGGCCYLLLVPAALLLAAQARAHWTFGPMRTAAPSTPPASIA